jgi:hypothetical protein
MARMVAGTIAGTVAALALVVALGANAQTAKWDQAAVTAAAAEFEKAVSGLRDAVRQSQQATLAPNRAQTYQILQDLRQIEWLAQSLHADLAKGETMEATTPAFFEILERRDYARVDAMYVDIGDFVKPKVEASRAALTKLQAFYPAPPKGT